MIRAFVALAVPPAVGESLARLQAGLPLPRPAAAEGFHLTLAFLGDQPEDLLTEAHHALAAIRAPGFGLQVAGAGLFGGARPHTVFAALAPSAPLMALQAKVEVALRRLGIALEARKFTPHVTLGRLRPNRAETARLEAAVAAAAGFLAPPWPVDGFGLWRSDPAPGGRVYTEVMRYPLG